MPNNVDVVPWTGYIYYATVGGHIVLDRSIVIYHNNKTRLNQRVDTLRDAGHQVFVLKNVYLKGVLT